MNNPDFSKSPEHVALADALGEAYLAHTQNEYGVARYMKRGTLLMLADAAITHLGTGIPAATEENAERLARAKWDAECKAAAVTFSFEIVGPLTARKRVEEAAHYLRALHAMMADQPEKPEPVFPTPCPSMQGDNPCEQLAGHEGPHSQGSLVWEDEDATVEGPGPDFTAEATERERRRLLEAFMHDMVSNPAVMAKMLENYEDDEDAIAARLHEIALAFAQELIG